MRELWKGNEAMAEAAVRAGLHEYVGYPITPQSEICEYLSSRMPEMGRVFIQSESELVSINTIIGGASAGYRCMTSSCSVGLALMQEGLGSAYAKALPIVLLNVNRTGTGMGFDFGGGTDDYSRDTHGGASGNYRIPVYVPNSVQEACDMVYHAFRTAFQYRTPVEIMTEGRLGQMMEDIELPPMVDNSEYQVPDWAYDGTTKIYDYNWGPHDEQHRARQKSMEDVLQEWELFHVDEKTETVIVTLGLPSRITKGAILEMEGAGEKIGMLRIKTAWPFPIKAFKALPDSVKRLIVVETSPLNSGLADDVLITAKKIPALRDIPVFVNNTQVLITRQELIDYVKQAKSGMIKEVG